jgi:surface polysaccharide O-acyltransferase-like enzyme
MIGGTILVEWMLPFLLVFVLIFAILEKSKLLGTGKEQINSLVSLSAAFLAVAVPYSREIIAELMPWLGVGLVSLFVFFILYAFIVGDKMFEGADWLKYVLIGIVAIFSLGVIFQVTGFWTFVESSVGFFNADMIGNGLVIVVAILLIFWVFKSSNVGPGK